MIWIGAVDLPTVTSTSNGARSNMKEYQQSATLDHLLVTIV